MRLQTRVLLPLLLTLGVLGAAAVGAVVQVGEQAALAEARSDLASLAVRDADEVNASITERVESIALLAFVKAEADFAAAALEASPEQAAQARAQLAALFRDASRDRFERIVVVDAAGRERAAFVAGAQTQPDAARDHAIAPEFQALRADPLRAPAVAVLSAPGLARLVAVAAVVDPAGDFAGVVRGEVPLAALAPAPRDEAAGTALVDARGARIDGEGTPLPAQVREAAGATAQDGRPRSILVDGGLYAVAEAAHPEGQADTPWLLVAHMPVAAATAPALQPVLLLSAALVLVAAAAAVAVALAVRGALRPLERLSKAVAALGSGAPAGQVEPEGPRELRSLAAAFNGMVARLQEREASLAREVETRARHAKFATLGSLSSGVAHEIKNPLTGMRLQSQLVAHLAGQAATAEQPEVALRSLAEASRRLVEVNERGIDRIEKVVASLSMLARPRPQLEPVELAPVVEASVALAGARLRGDSHVHVDVPPGLVAMASTDGLGQVLLNLLANAADAVAPEAGWIRIAAARRGERVELTVEDNGPGLAPEVAARLGEPFFSTKPGGTGLGLSISMRIVEELGGTLRFENRPEGGARFVVDLAHVPAPPPRSHVAGAPAPAGRHRHGTARRERARSRSGDRTSDAGGSTVS